MSLEQQSRSSARFVLFLLAPLAGSAFAFASPALAEETGVRTRAASGGPDSFADLAESRLDTVVNISTTQAAPARLAQPEMPDLPPGSPFEEFFRQFQDRGNGERNDGPDGSRRERQPVTAL